ncbi:MAG TPA: ubiquinone biosynthesis protein UbiA [Cytophagales bacterium]|nr:ubiquinone biosynthesis protein UbiA [Cytophagales bacterium]
MFSLSTWLHLRIPFSFFLMPVYLFALGHSPNFTESRIILSFLIIHLLLYPASNGYNSYFDKDEKSIGGLKNPPPVRKGLYYTSLFFDLVAVLIGMKISFLFAAMLVVYGLVSKAYSHPSIRLKKFAISGWIITGFFQGFFTFLMCYEGINAFGFTGFKNPNVLIPGLLTTLMLWANYPMTQVYQHEEDRKRGDKTLSLLLGVRGTFVFTALMFGVAVLLFALYFIYFYKMKYAIVFLLSLSPVLMYFFIWLAQAFKNEEAVTYGRTMWLNFISAICLNGFFVYFFLDTSQVIQAIKAGF